MAFELISNLVLLVFFIFCYFSIGQLPDARPGEMSSKLWPQALLILLIFCAIANMCGVWRKNRGQVGNVFSEIRNAVRSVNVRFLIGVVLCFAYPFALSYAGFIPTSILFIIAYMTLLGEQRWGMRATIGVSITILLYAVFRVLLQVPLSRGTGIFRTFSLVLERLFQ